jgi:hypothetical protein
MDDATFFSRDFHRKLAMDFSTRGARAMAARGELERWLHAYLTCEPRWANPGLANGLRRAPRRYRGPLEMPVALLERKCGPEPEMEFRQDPASFEEHIRAIAASLVEPEDLPPLVVEDLGGRLMVCDGTHRLEAVRRRGWPTFAGRALAPDRGGGRGVRLRAPGRFPADPCRFPKVLGQV